VKNLYIRFLLDGEEFVARLETIEYNYSTIDMLLLPIYHNDWPSLLIGLFRFRSSHRCSGGQESVKVKITSSLLSYLTNNKWEF
jgi:hypothetical protein